MESLTVGQRVSRAILMEASSIKAGNVHPGASFSDMMFEDFRVASSVIGQAFDRTISMGKLGPIVLAGVEAMVDAVCVNTSLGTILLLAPMALCPLETYPGQNAQATALDLAWNPEPFCQSITKVLRESTEQDSQSIYEAIRIANPGGLGRVETQDVRESPPTSILDAMQQASRWDDVALQYVNGYQQVIQYGRRLLELAERYPITDAITYLQIEILASRPDSLIVRKHGQQIGQQVQQLALGVLQSDSFGAEKFRFQWNRFDEFLRENGRRKNPGTTADLIAAAIFLVSHRLDSFDG